MRKKLSLWYTKRLPRSIRNKSYATPVYIKYERVAYFIVVSLSPNSFRYILVQCTVGKKYLIWCKMKIMANN